MPELNKREYAGRHLLIEFWDCRSLNTPEEMENLLKQAALHANSTPLKSSSVQFDPQGITSFVILAESHISAHTWPEIGYIAFDIFTCGDHTMPHKALDYLQKSLQPKRFESKEIKRGHLT